MGSYVDGFLVPVIRRRRAEYLRMARVAKHVWLDHGALQYLECEADDVQFGKWTSFPRAVKLRKNETVWFSFIIYKSRRHRDLVNAKVMKDPRIAKFMNLKTMPFDGKRMIWGGFKTLVRG